ncbi:heme-binding domain-containing protein [Cerasicoccus arenae]|uniref:Cytochrome c n=1 Tax=Cerasicoccus arenae TaxID=424488 RepID=A0A8J3DEZ2_9BACT|nr:heme-binding domain-containing protein [Cerasicoccus arenae]MBK1859766.1 heme-binding domain-containing protein [Cerasicoccus arenae]GHB90952.1 cytochrome c [Cerasicoccus arenae]
MKKRLLQIFVVLIVIFIGIQFVPVDDVNPPVTHEVHWANAQTKEYFMGACADCHSNETVWPWYAKVAPASWWLAHHVEEGREHFNISVPDMGDAHEAYEAVHEGWMPLGSYTWMHPKARLTLEQREEFSAGLKLTFNADGEYHSDDHHGHSH